MQLYIIVPLNFRNIVKYGFIFVLPTALLPCSWNQPIWWCSLCWISWASKVVYVSYYVYITIHSVDFGIRKTKQHRTKQTNEKKKNGYNYSKRNKLPLSLLGDLFVTKKYQLCTLCKELTLHILLWSVMYFYPAQQYVMLFRWLSQSDNCTGHWYCVTRIKS